MFELSPTRFRSFHDRSSNCTADSTSTSIQMEVLNVITHNKTSIVDICAAAYKCLNYLPLGLVFECMSFHDRSSNCTADSTSTSVQRWRC